ncbi:unnamed protein product, partial [Staurois parvus]
ICEWSQRSHGTRLFTTALYHVGVVTSCDQIQLSQYFSIVARMQPERRRNYCFYSLYGYKSNQCKINFHHPPQVVQCQYGFFEFGQGHSGPMIPYCPGAP